MSSDFTTDFTDYAREDLDRSGPAEWAFQTLLRIAAFGLHDSNRAELREITKTAQERYRAANPEGDPR